MDWLGTMRCAVGSVPRRLAPALVRALVGTRARGQHPPRSVLVVRTDEIGDLALTLPLLTGIRAAWPKVRVTVVAAAGPDQLLSGSSLADEVFAWRRLPQGQGTLVGQVHAWRLARRLIAGRGRFDLAVLPRRDVEARGARYIAAAAARTVVGFDPADRPAQPWERAERCLLDLPVPGGRPDAHELQHLQRLADAIGLPALPGSSLRPGAAVVGHREQPLPAPIAAGTGLVVAVALGAGAPKRCWDPAAYAQVVARLHAALPIRVLLLGGPGDRDLGEQFLAALPTGIPVADAIGTANLRSSTGLLASSDLYLGGDTGTMHLASSVNLPSLVVSCHPADGNRTGTNAPNRFGPWSELNRTVRPTTGAAGCTGECRAGYPHCITTITVERVVTELLALIDDLRSKKSHVDLTGGLAVPGRPDQSGPDDVVVGSAPAPAEAAGPDDVR